MPSKAAGPVLTRPVLRFAGLEDEYIPEIPPSGETLRVLNDYAAPEPLRDAVNQALKNFRFSTIQEVLRDEGWKVAFAELPDEYPGKLTRENAREKTIVVPVLEQDGGLLVAESLTCLYEGLAEAVDTALGPRKLNVLGVLARDKAYLRQPLSTTEGFRQAVEKDYDAQSMAERVLHRNNRLHDVFRQELADLFQYGLPGSSSGEGQTLLALAASLNGAKDVLPPTRFPQTRVWLTNALLSDLFPKIWAR